MTEDTPPEEQQPPEQAPQRGSMRFQDPETTKPREPSLAEQRARRKALAEEKERTEAAKQAYKEAERKAATRRKVLIGSGVTVGLVGVVAAWYLVGTPETVNAVCTDSNNVVQPDEYCDDNYAVSHGGYYNAGTGFWFIPIPGGGGYTQYRYNYGGTGTVGQPVSGGTYTKPSGNPTIKTNSGKTVQRGGFGISGKSSGGSGKSGGS
ncbi:hypothetical protein SAMN05421835_110231 [Amycolatopsis sacchari]|uniref:Uncharacterized protein n=1 Tax=Amycolatopsis sacchari TaxID=115433 RepID=A0A1I3VBB7_9PSEU|nr:cell envelope integrity protein TolA [Amycolatopsis sacchari]SFJ92293.1 hypothetical protein SAMN05421835_110231 [Amycolatopsis sacchari]